MSNSKTSHEQQAREHGAATAIACGVLTISDTRTIETDTSGELIVQLLQRQGHRVAQRAIVPDEPPQIERTIRTWLGEPDLAVILTTGGTGIARRDTTIEVVRRLLTTELDGFGELFRMVSWTEIGSAAMLSRAVGGLIVRDGDDAKTGDVFLFAMPGSRNAVETAMSKLILPQLPHLIWERSR